MGVVHAEIASHVLQEGMFPVRLRGGPWDGKEVCVRDRDAPLLRVNGPRHGRHSVWITHLYKRRGDRYEFVVTEIIPLSAWNIGLGNQASAKEESS
jgi:hypothetical protein